MQQPLLTRLVTAYLRSPLRGRSRVASALAHRVPALREVPVGDGVPVYFDLRDVGSHDVVRRAPESLTRWEPATQLVARTFARPGDVAFDVGANRGIYLCHLARCVGPTGRVYAFEPNPMLGGFLRRTAAAAGNAEVVPYALSDTNGEAQFFLPENSEMGSLGDWTAEPDALVIRCQTRRLDDLVREGTLPAPRFIKMDVEGAEWRVLTGAREVLDREDAPVLVYESNVFASPVVSGVPASAAGELLTSLPRAGYRLFVIFPWGLLLPLHPAQLVHENVLAVPAARLAEWPELGSAPYVRLSI